MSLLPVIDPPASPSPIPVPDLDAVAVGTTANDGTGDPMRTAFGKVNTNLSTMLGALQAAAPVAWTVTDIQTTNYTASVGCFCIRMSATGGDRTVTLPPAADVEGHAIEIIKWDSSGNIVTPIADGTDTLYMASGDEELTTQYQSIRLRSVGDGWVKV
jgi:hypothetical protein